MPEIMTEGEELIVRDRIQRILFQLQDGPITFELGPAEADYYLKAAIYRLDCSRDIVVHKAGLKITIVRCHPQVQ